MDGLFQQQYDSRESSDQQRYRASQWKNVFAVPEESKISPSIINKAVTALFLLPEEKILFFGDAMSGVFPTWIADPDLKEQFIRVIEETDCEKCVGGHWPVFTKQELLKELRS